MKDPILVNQFHQDTKRMVLSLVSSYLADIDARVLLIISPVT